MHILILFVSFSILFLVVYWSHNDDMWQLVFVDTVFNNLNLLGFWMSSPRDLSLHKLVFGENGLPEGTEVGYYVRGQVVTVRNQSFRLIILIAHFLFWIVIYCLQQLLVGYKRGSGIFCTCCNSEVLLICLNYSFLNILSEILIFFVLMARSVHHNLRLMLVGHHAANRECLFSIFRRLWKNQVALRLEWSYNFYLAQG